MLQVKANGSNSEDRSCRSVWEPWQSLESLQDRLGDPLGPVGRLRSQRVRDLGGFTPQPWGAHASTGEGQAEKISPGAIGQSRRRRLGARKPRPPVDQGQDTALQWASGLSTNV